jgi:conjugative transposon TraM protein
MKSAAHAQTYLRKRKMMMVMPLLAIPFITLAFWALGGGKGNPAETNIAIKHGLNLNLPDASLKGDELSDKLGFYEKADKDSLKLEELIRNDPYYKSHKDSITSSSSNLEQLTQATASKYNQRLNTSPYETAGDNPEQKIMLKLALLQKQLDKPATDSSNDSKDNSNTEDVISSSDVSKLAGMMQGINKPENGDPEMNQLNNTLDKILDIQHPQRVKDKLNTASANQKETVFAVTRRSSKMSISLLDTSATAHKAVQSFFGADNAAIDNEQNSIEAVVHEAQTLVNGSVVKLRLVNDIYINGSFVPKGNFVFGIAALNDERLTIEITSLRSGQSIFPVKLEVFDLDGLPGIYVPGAITRDVAKQPADNSLQLMELSAVDPSFKAQAAAAGISSAKSLISKKVKQVKVMVKAGYKVLLKDKNIQQ